MMRRTLYIHSIILILVCFLTACSSSEKTPETPADAAKKTTSQTASQDTQASKLSPALKEKKTVASFNQEVSQSNDTVARELDKAAQFMAAGNKQQALTVLDQAASKAPKAFLVPYNKGLVYEWSGDSNAALLAYQKALSIEPKFSPALLNIVRLYISRGEIQSAYNISTNYVQNYPDAFDHNIARIEALIAQKKYDDAVSECRRLLKLDEANPRLRYEIALAEYYRGRYNLAEFVVKEALELVPDDVDSLFLLSKIHAHLSLTDATYATTLSSEYDRVLELQPNHVEALWRRGILYYQANDYTNAEATFRKMINIAPNIYQGYVNLANVLKTINRGPEAESYLKKANELSPENSEIAFAFGTLYMNTEIITLPGVDDLERLKNARSYFESAISYTTDKAEIKLFKGYIKTTDDAIETLQAMREAEALFGPSSSTEETSASENAEMSVD
ncbi:MAG: tetratricopeptide repeat protein [Proteobacteria bacterium]|nr:tetratricopeptide repeat protein [Pseudomonadota bacterium]